MQGHRTTLWSLTAGHRLRYGGAVLALLAGVQVLYLVPLVTRAAIDSAVASGPGSAAGGGPDLSLRLLGAALLVVALTAVSGAFAYLRGRWSAEASEGIARRLRDRLYDHLQRLPAAYHDRADSGDLVQRCTSDVETVRLFLAVQAVEVGRAAAMLVLVLPLMLRLDPRMTLVSLGLLPAVIAFAVVFFARVRGAFTAADEAEAAMTTCLHENLTGIRVVRAFARQAYECDRFAVRNAAHRDLWRRLIDLLARYWALADLLCVGQIALSVLAGAAWVRGGSLSPGTYFAFLSYLYLLMAPVRHVGRVLSEMGKAAVSLGRLREVLDQPAEDSGGAPLRLSEVRGELVVSRLGFSHRGEGQAALVDVSFDLRPGETLALVGPPGSGKSTLVHLLLRLYDYQTGSIRLDGRELRDLDRRSVRRAIGAVLQEPFLYSRTLAENLRLGRAGATAAELREAAGVAAVDAEIAGFEAGYDTLIGERGVTLSGGQRQRVAIARALLQDSPLLVLDDALSAVDTATEARIEQALRTRAGRRTTIVIAHRLSTLMRADRVLVLEAGRIVQAGTHASLTAADGPYRRLWRIQSELEEEIQRDGAGALREEAS